MQPPKIEPKLAVSTQGKTSKQDGASLTYKLTYPANALGNDANIKYVKVTLPKALPSRLTTLQRACLAKEFQANPAFHAVPDGWVGHQKSFEITLPEGKFSALGTNKNLCALTTTKTTKTKVDKRTKGKLVRKNGKLVREPGKLVKVNGKIVKETKKTTKTVAEPLVMGNEYIGQNGATYNATTPLTVTGCPKAHAAKKSKKGKGHKKGEKSSFSLSSLP